MDQDHRDRAAAEAGALDRGEDAVQAAVPGWGRGAFVSVLTAEKKNPTNRGRPVMVRSVPNAAKPWSGNRADPTQPRL